MKGVIARSTIRTSFVLALRLFVQAGTLLIVSRILGLGQFGAFSGISALALILGALSTFGTNWILLGGVSKDPLCRDKILAYALPTTFVLSTLLFLIFVSLSRIVLVNISFPVLVVLFVGTAEILLQPLLTLMATEHHGLGRTAQSQLLQIVPLILRMLVAALVLITQVSNPLVVYALGYWGASLLALICGAALLPARWPGWKSWRMPTRSEYRKAAGYAAINVSKAGPGELDKTLAAKLLPIETAGVYAVGARVIGAFTLPVTAMTLSALPRLFRTHKDDEVEQRGFQRWMFFIAASYSLLFSAFLWWAAPAIDWLFGYKYLGLPEMIRWLCLAVPAISIRLVAGNVLSATGSTWMRVAFECIGILVLTILAAVLIPQVGIHGMPIALAISEWSMAIMGVFLIFLVNRSV